MSIVDEALGWFKTRFRNEAEHRISFMMEATHVRRNSKEPADSRELKSGEHYFRLWLSEMFLKYDRNWFSSWYPAVHSAIAFQYGNQQPQVITRVAGAENLKGLSKENLDRAVTQDVDLTTLIPFNGGTVNITAALFKMQGGNDVERLIAVMGDFSKKFALAQLSGVLDVAGSLATGIGALVGATNGSMMTAIDCTLSGVAGAENVLRAGYFVTIAANEGELDKSKLWVKAGQLYCGDSFDTSKRLGGYSYMLFRLECADKRDDYDSLSSIQEPFNSAIDMLTLGQMDSAAEFFKKAIAAAIKAPELTMKVDRTRAIVELKQRFNKAKGDLGQAAFRSEKPVRSLTQLLESRDAISVETAAAMPMLRTLDEALQGL